jgi:hypothetical protein
LYYTMRGESGCVVVEEGGGSGYAFKVVVREVDPSTARQVCFIAENVLFVRGRGI